MFCLKKPSEERVRQFIESQCDLPFSYLEVGATNISSPADHTIDHNRIRLGSDDTVFNAALRIAREEVVGGQSAV